jgi:ABC-type transport system involved in multi-copper enzyme maturation permease subunit
MMRGVLAKSVREALPGTILFGFALAVVLALLTFVIPQVQEGIGEIVARMPIVQTMLSALIGMDIGDEMNAQVMQAILWVHPVALATIWAHEIIECTRIPAGEIDRGTIDVLLGWPVSRQSVYLAHTVVWLVSGIVVLLAGWLGHLTTAGGMDPSMRPSIGVLLLIMLNLFGVYVAVGGIAMLVSSLSERRGRAVGSVFAFVVASFLLNFLAQFWTPAEHLAWLSVLTYYRPAELIADGAVPWRDLLVLIGSGLVAWLIAGLVFTRRSICTT